MAENRERSGFQATAAFVMLHMSHWFTVRNGGVPTT